MFSSTTRTRSCTVVDRQLKASSDEKFHPRRRSCSAGSRSPDIFKGLCLLNGPSTFVTVDLGESSAHHPNPRRSSYPALTRPSSSEEKEVRSMSESNLKSLHTCNQRLDSKFPTSPPLSASFARPKFDLQEQESISEDYTRDPIPMDSVVQVQKLQVLAKGLATLSLNELAGLARSLSTAVDLENGKLVKALDRQCAIVEEMVLARRQVELGGRLKAV